MPGSLCREQRPLSEQTEPEGRLFARCFSPYPFKASPFEHRDLIPSFWVLSWRAHNSLRVNFCLRFSGKEMANDITTSTGAGSEACSDSSNLKSEHSNDSQSCPVDSSDNASSSDQSRSHSASEDEECLAREVCLKNKQPEGSNCSGNSEGQSSSRSENSVCKSKCLLKSKRETSKSKSSSECTDSNATASSTETVSEESSKNKKVANDKKRDSEHTKPKEGSDTDGNASGWSLSEDVLLRSMKEASDGLSWEDIGKSLNRGKGECKGRWKFIKDEPLQDKPSEDEAKETARQAKQAPARAKASTKDDSKAPAPADETRATGGAVNGLLRSSLEDLVENDCQRQYWREHIGRRLYAASIRVEPDAHFSRGDCLVLEMIDARYRSTRWQEIQARFFNETGRMVPLEVIRRKCEDAATRTEADIAGWLDSIPD